ncbi:1113_t:CDS:2 [Paraglomus occultum]|uniref:1113_t:CDS:1 n=1 Tax=Paraglomus occultum TaxID=144539 RepID=A0A9N8WPJ2_9GLOM|nr:1113_t:CDS:2 [Paraglomus occultum]
MADIPNITEDFSRYQIEFYRRLLRTQEAAKKVSGEEIRFQRVCDREFRQSLDRIGEKLLHLTNSLITRAAGEIYDGTIQSFADLEDVEDRFTSVADLNDNLLERVDVCLDEFTGRAEQIAGTATPNTPVVAKKDWLDRGLMYAQGILRPQMKFRDTIDNGDAPFIPKIREKPNALVPLKNYDNPGPDDCFTHPYEYEINNMKYPQHLLNKTPESIFQKLENTPFTLVETEEQLEEICRRLEAAQEIAIDLEHHDYRSYQGITCLVQISTRQEDFIIDALALRHVMHWLNQSFTDPNIVKVLHGAQMDVLWLQRDFGVYIVNLFDTFHASNVLDFGKHSLAHLLKHYCGVDADKKYQLADWRLRPLPAEMIKYAREDTHYLLYIYDRMRHELIDRSAPGKDILQVVLDRSRETSLTVYKKMEYDVENGSGFRGWKNLLAKWNHILDNQQLAVFKAIHEWRDKTARLEDESVTYVLPNHMLFEISRKMPVDPPGVLACCNPPPTLVRIYAADIAIVIKKVVTDVKPDDKSLEPESLRNMKTLTISSKSGFIEDVEMEDIESLIKSKRFEEEPTNFSYLPPTTTRPREKSLLFGNIMSLSSDSETDLDEIDREAKRKAAMLKANLRFPMNTLYPNDDSESEDDEVMQIDEGRHVKRIL